MIVREGRSHETNTLPKQHLLINKRRCFCILLLLCIIALLPARGNRDREAANVVRVTGVVRLVGTGLFPELVITGAEMEWYIAQDEAKKLHDMQHRTVTVEGVETVSELRFANGLSAGARRELKNIKIIDVLLDPFPEHPGHQ